MKCKAPKCGKEITFVMNPRTARKYPVDPGLVRIVTKRGEIATGFILHRETCGDPDFFERGRRE